MYAVLLLAVVSAPDPVQEDYGTVKAVNQKTREVTIAREGKADLTLPLPKGANIRDGKFKVDFASVKPGRLVRVVYRSVSKRVRIFALGAVPPKKRR
jgi:hypothetical protein